jgi:hypothetical protein
VGAEELGEDYLNSLSAVAFGERGEDGLLIQLHSYTVNLERLFFVLQ